MKKLLLLTIIIVSLSQAAEIGLSSELLAQYYKKEQVTTENGHKLDVVTIRGPSVPPSGMVRRKVDSIDALKTTGSTNIIKTSASVSLAEVPAFDWSFGCAATSGAMVAGYYDRNLTTYPNIYTGLTNAGVMPLDNAAWPDVMINGENRHQCPLSATRNGLEHRTTAGHVDDYWVANGSSAADPWIAGGVRHAHDDCVGDFMKTNQSDIPNEDGATTFYFWVDGSPLTATQMVTEGIDNKDGGYGLKLFFEHKGYPVTSLYNQYIYPSKSSGFTFKQYTAEIDAGRPVLVHVTGHTMVGVGYDCASCTVYLHDTWDYHTHSMTWGESYAGMNHMGVTVLDIPGAGGSGSCNESCVGSSGGSVGGSEEMGACTYNANSRGFDAILMLMIALSLLYPFRERFFNRLSD